MTSRPVVLRHCQKKRRRAFITSETATIAAATWFADEVARQAGLPEPRKISRAQAEEEFSPARLAFLASSRIVDTTKMREVLGVTPRAPEEGIRDSLS